MRAWCLVAITLLVSVTATPAHAQQRYPLVYGPAGRPYGPTQAHYQYLRQYGQPWHGYGGLVAPPGVETGLHVTNGSPAFGWSGWGWGGGFASPFFAPPVAVFAPGYSAYFGPVFGPPVWGGAVFGSTAVSMPFPQATYVPTASPAWPNPWVQPPLTEPLAAAQRENNLRWGDSLPVLRPVPSARAGVPSTTEARLRSLEAQGAGDHHLRNQKWLQAYIDYKRAVQIASDRADAHLRLAMTLVALGQYDSAGVSLKRALLLDPGLPQSEFTLDNLFGPGSELARNSIAHKLLEHVRADIRDPDRLFLFGAWLHFDDDPRAREFLETGLRLAGEGSHFAAFLQSAPKPAAPKEPAVEPPPNPALPPAPLPDLTIPADDGPRFPTE
jgi:hypothetical protein